MKDTKRQLVTFAFYDHTSMEHHFEKMAAKGWLFEKFSTIGWRYRRIEPKKLHFTVTYYPKASGFDSEPSEEQQTFWDFCERAGWKLADSAAQMQVFYNEEEDPVPIETDAELQIENVHHAAKRGYLPTYFLLLFTALLQAGLFFQRLNSSPIRLLSSSIDLISGFFWILGLIFLWVKF